MNRRDFVAAAGLGMIGGAAAPAAVSKENPEPEAADGMDWAKVRAQFNLAPGRLHFSQFFLVSHPLVVREAIEKYRRMLDADPLGTVEKYVPLESGGGMPAELTRSAADYIGGVPEEVAITDSTTQGLALIYNGLSFRAGDEILTSTHDHYVHHESIRFAAERSGATWRRIALYDPPADASAEQMVERVHRAIGPGTRVIGLTWVQSSSGVKTPVRAMSEMIAAVNRSRDEQDRILFVLDAVHGFGNQGEPLASLGVDFAASGTHKWIFAPRGTGIIWAPERNWGFLRPTIPSFFSPDPVLAWISGHPPKTPTKASWVTPGGFKAYEHQWAMLEAFAFHRRIGRERVSARIASLNTQCKEGLARIPKVRLYTPRDPALSAGIICFEVEGQGVEETVRRLLDRKVVASSSPYKISYVRLAPSLVNDENEVDAALRAVKEVAA
jgi:selenocysteine lyase/cysteine desulfurase